MSTSDEKNHVKKQSNKKQLSKKNNTNLTKKERQIKKQSFDNEEKLKKAEIVKEIEVDNQKQNQSSIYLGYKSRVFIHIFLFISLMIGFSSYLIKSIRYETEKYIKYQEKSHLDYKVYLKENTFYDEPYLGKNMIYVANLIDKVSVDYKYIFDIEENIDMIFNYSIVGNMVIADESGNNIYFEKEYILLENQEKQINNQKNFEINENIVIDYDYFNNLANNFKISYGLDTTSSLNIYLKIQKNNVNQNEIISLNENDSMFISIPLSERSINIKMNYKELNLINKLVTKSNLSINNTIYIIISMAFLVLAVITLGYTIKLILLSRTKKNNYDKRLEKILTEYDRIIVETTTFEKVNPDKIIKIKKFEELVDVRDNLKIPIMFYNVVAHQKSHFYIVYNEKMYLYTLKAVDINK